MNTQTRPSPATGPSISNTHTSARGAQITRQATGVPKPKLSAPAGSNVPAANPTPTPIPGAQQDLTSPVAISGSTPTNPAPRGTKSTGSQCPDETQLTFAAGSNSRSANTAPTPTHGAPSGPTSPAASPRSISTRRTPQGNPTSGRHVPIDTRGTGAAGSSSPAPNRKTAPKGRSAREPELADRQMSSGTQWQPAVGLDSPDPAAKISTVPASGSLLDPALTLTSVGRVR